MYDGKEEVAVEHSMLRHRECRLVAQSRHVRPHSRALRQRLQKEVERQDQWEAGPCPQMYDTNAYLLEAESAVSPSYVVGVGCSVNAETTRSCLSRTPCLRPGARLLAVRVHLASWTRLANSTVVMLAVGGLRWRLR